MKIKTWLIGLAVAAGVMLAAIGCHEKQQKGTSRDFDTINTGTGPNTGTGMTLLQQAQLLNDMILFLNAIGLDDLTAQDVLNLRHLIDSLAVRDAEIALKANSDSPIFTTTATLPASLTIGSSSVTGTEAYSSENYGSTGTGNIVLSTGPTLTTVNITDVIKLTPTASPPAGATEGMIYADTDHHLYYYNGTSWISMTD